MKKHTTFTGIPALLTAALLAAACHDSISSDRSGLAVPMFDVAGPPNVVLDQKNGSFSESGTLLGMGFSTNPHHGDAVIATFFWQGSSNIITSVTDHLSATGYPLVGNTYRLVEYVTQGGISMATYVATNVQNFPEGYNGPNGDSLLVVHATLSASVTDGGAMLSAYTGVHAVYTRALGAHRSLSGSGSSTVTTDPGALPTSARCRTGRSKAMENISSRMAALLSSRSGRGSTRHRRRGPG